MLEQAAGAVAITVFRPPHCILRKARRDDHSRLVLSPRPLLEFFRDFGRGILHIGGVGRRRRGSGCRCRYRRGRRGVGSGVSLPSFHALIGSNPEVATVVPSPSHRFIVEANFIPAVRQPWRLEMSPHRSAYPLPAASPPTREANAPVPDCAIKLGNRCFQRDGRIVANRDRPQFLQSLEGRKRAYACGAFD